MVMLTAICAWVILMITSSLLNGIALKLLWGWFAVPTFGLPMISIVQAIGVTVVIGLLTHQHIPRGKDGGKSLIYFELGSPLMAIIIGWVVHQFM